MADGLNERPLVQATDEHVAEAPMPSTLGLSGRSAREASPHSHRFRAATAMLVGIAIGAIVIALAALTSSNGTSAQKWSSWSPADDGIQGAREIADHLAPLYRISGVNQLDIVTVSNLNNSSAATASSGTSGTSGSSGSPGSGGLQVAVRADPSSSAVSLISGNTIAYTLCGIGTSNCSIGAGTPSADRLLLLRREALELALYTFKYISNTQNVVAILPPGHTQPASTLSPKPPTSGAKGAGAQPVDLALLFLRDELKPWLDQPISDTFPEQFPPTVPELSLWKQTPEAALVAQITERGLFSEHISSTQDGTNLIVLDPEPPQ